MKIYIPDSRASMIFPSDDNILNEIEPSTGRIDGKLPMSVIVNKFAENFGITVYKIRRRYDNGLNLLNVSLFDRKWSAASLRLSSVLRVKVIEI